MTEPDEGRPSEERSLRDRLDEMSDEELAATGRISTVPPEPPPPPPPPPPDDRDEDTHEPPRKKGWRSQLAELPVLITLALVIAVIIKTFIAQAFYIPSASMFPTLHNGDRVLVEKVGYHFDEPSRGDVVVFARDVFGPDRDLPWWQDVRDFARDLLGLPTSAEEDYIKRVVAVEGDIISYKGHPRVLTINGEAVDEPWIRGGTDGGSQALTAKDCDRLGMDAQDGGCVIPEGDVFVMGDNRGNSEDSRVIGPIHKGKIVGRAFAIVWPPGNFGGL